MNRARAVRLLVPAAASATGLTLGAVFLVVARVRGSKPLHPDGIVLPATIQLTATDDVHGARELGSPRRLQAVVRLSRSAGLPDGWPDVHGIAIRWEHEGQHQDVLLSSSGLGRVSRFLLVPRRAPLSGPYSTLMPFQGEDGPVLLAAVPERRGKSQVARGPQRTQDVTSLDLVLLTARPGGRWHRLGHLVAEALERPHDVPLRFDPVANCPDGLATYGWLARLRRPAYRAARAGFTA
ncbi:hypothetical protein [Sanguibacter suaedae]|uniref:Phosphodiesterase n=1 Tax=Sanguibacter suaedae TaxID=2795737 RepID=A0A934MC39_9MICO|nr:hypothetical protein [Sanguibacter suaedae]MBI9115991.1 hypothetical protein [Sanguibacter suaedae]